MQIEVLLTQKYSNIIYFAEDDYFYMPNQFEEMVRFLTSEENVDFVSPYDHLDYYTLDLHKHKNWIRVSENKHWRTASTTCLTFLTTKSTLKQTQDIFRSYCKNNYDASVWLSLTKMRLATIINYYRKDKLLFDIIKNAWRHGWKQILFGKKWGLWVPIPAIATHLESECIAPTIDWISIMQRQIKDNRLGD